MKLKTLTKFAFASSLLIAGSSFAEESNVELSGQIRASLDRTDSSTSRPNFTNAGFGRLTAAGKKMGNDQLWGSGLITLQSALAGGVATQEVYAKVGGDSWDIVAGRFLVAKFTDFTGTDYDGFYIASNGGNTISGHYELTALNGKTEALGFHYNHSDELKLEVALMLGNTDNTGATPDTKNTGLRPHVEYKRDNFRFVAGLEMINKKGNQNGVANHNENYKDELFGFGLAFGYELGDLCFGLSFASNTNDVTPVTGAKTEGEATTFSGKVGYKVNEDWKLGLTVVNTSEETKATGTTTENSEMAWLIAADYNLAAGTSLRLGHSVADGEREVTGARKVEHAASHTKVELKYVF